MNYENEEKSKLLQEIMIKKNEVENYIKRIEKNIYDYETKYLETTQTTGNVIRGWDQFFTVKSKLSQVPINPQKRTKFTNNERLFSQSSYNNQYLKDDVLSINNPSVRNSTFGNTNLSNKISSNHRHKKKMVSSLSLKKKKFGSHSKPNNTKKTDNDNEYNLSNY